jgi:hypothetical protein
MYSGKIAAPPGGGGIRKILRKIKYVYEKEKVERKLRPIC